MQNLLFIAAMASAALPCWSAEPYPSRPVRMLASFGAGSTADFAARVLSQQLNEQMGKTFVVDNRTGASGTIGYGLLGLILAANRPERVASVGCFNTPYRSPQSENTMKDLFRCGYANFDEAIDQLGVEGWVRKLCESGVLIDRGDPAIVEWVVKQAASIPPTVAHEWHRVFGRTSSLLTDMTRVQVPVLLVAGANHVHGCEPPLLDRLKGKLEHARDVVYIPDVAIGVQLLKADACAAAYLDFLRGVDGAAC